METGIEVFIISGGKTKEIIIKNNIYNISYFVAIHNQFHKCFCLYLFKALDIGGRYLQRYDDVFTNLHYVCFLSNFDSLFPIEYACDVCTEKYRLMFIIYNFQKFTS